MKAPLVPAVFFSLALSWAAPQATPPAKDAPAPAAQPQPAAARETPPDMKAFQDASRTADPAKKIAALEKFQTDFPESQMAQNAGMAVLSTLAQKMPDQAARIRQKARALYQAAPEKDKGRVAAQIADALLSGSVALKDAEDYAKKGVQAMQQAAYLAEQRAAIEKRKQTVPAEGELIKRFKTSRASRVATLGQIEIKLGQKARGQKLLEEAYADNPTLFTAAAVLGELTAKAGNDAKALDYLIPARLSGRAPEAANAALEAVYRKSHNGSLDGLDAMLDTEYHKRYPNPAHAEAYKPSEKRSNRVVLGEVFTGSGCPPCAGADVAFDAAMERYSRNDLAVVMYHLHIPRPDPMTNPDTQARAKSYTVNGVPTFAIDGKKTVGGGGRENAKEIFERFRPDLEKDLETPAEAGLRVEAALIGETVGVTAFVQGAKSDSPDLKLQVLLVEKEIRFNGENGIRFHPMVVRATGGPQDDGFAVAPHTWFTQEQVFDLDHVSAALRAHLDDYEAKGHRGESFKFAEKKYQINRGELAVVAFIQDDKTKHVLQAVYVDLNPQPAPRMVSDLSN
ncbi:MAG: Omp28-related outer membrane protein [Acidobacteriia bacterium]|nr:Omp28-related outer membrane protein [Terriglobia bacterium]